MPLEAGVATPVELYDCNRDTCVTAKNILKALRYSLT